MVFWAGLVNFRRRRCILSASPEVREGAAMSTEEQAYADWLDQAAVVAAHLTPAQHSVLRAAFAFLQERGTDYYSRRLLSHFLLHSRTGLKTAAIARLT